MNISKSFFGVVFLALLLAGCGGGGGGGSQTPPLLPPSQVSATPSETNFGYFSVAWVEPSSGVDGYELEAKAGTSEFQKVGGSNISPGVTHVTVSMAGPLAELAPVAFRLRSIRSSTYSGYSNEAASRTPLKPPSFFSAYWDSSAGAMNLSWSNASTLATTVKVERATVLGGKPGSFSSVFEGPVSATRALDVQIEEDTTYQYRVSVQSTTDASNYLTATPSPVPFMPPTKFAATSIATGTLLTWQAASPKTSELLVQRGTGTYYPSYTTIASVPLGSQQYLDAGITSGFYSYRLMAKAGSQTVYSAAVQVVTPPTGTALALKTSLLGLPRDLKTLTVWGTTPAFLTRGTETYSYVLTPPSGATWPARTVFNVSVISSASLLFDGLGRPHFLFRRNMGTAYPVTQAVIHEWFNGSAWVSEELFRGQFNDSSAFEGIRFAVSREGSVHALWQFQSTGAPIVWYGTNRAGTWESLQLQPTGGISNLGSFRLTVGETGTVYAALGLWDRVVLFSRPSGIASFAQEVVPTGLATAGWYDALEVQPFGSRLAIFYERDLYEGTISYNQMCVIRDQGTWSQPTLLIGRPHTGASTVTKAAVSPDGGRLAYGVIMPEGLTVFVLQADQTWSPMLLAPTGSYSPIWIGFNGQNKFWAALNLGWDMVDSTKDVYAWYQE